MAHLKGSAIAPTIGTAELDRLVCRMADAFHGSGTDVTDVDVQRSLESIATYAERELADVASLAAQASDRALHRITRAVQARVDELSWLARAAESLEELEPLGSPELHEPVTLAGGDVPAHEPGAYPRLGCCGGPVELRALEA